MGDWINEYAELIAPVIALTLMLILGAIISYVMDRGFKDDDAPKGQIESEAYVVMDVVGSEKPQKSTCRHCNGTGVLRDAYNSEPYKCWFCNQRG